VIGNAASNAARRTKSKPSRQTGRISVCIIHGEDGHGSLCEQPTQIRSEPCVAPGWRVSGEELPRIVGTAPERELKFQEVIGGGQVGEADGVHALAYHIGEVLENRRQLQDGWFFTHSEPTPGDKGSEDQAEVKHQ
jgi:hypothetical protein